MANSDFGNSRIKARGMMEVGPDYQVSCWIQPRDNWDNETNQPKPMTMDQYNTVKKVMDIMNNNNFQLSVTIRQRIEGQQARSWLEKMKFKIFPNDDNLNPGPLANTNTQTDVKKEEKTDVKFNP